MPTIKSPGIKKTATTLTVAVKCRPLTERERGRDIVRVRDGKEVMVLDPDLSKDYLERVQNRTKEKQYCFDHAFGPQSSNLDVYNRCISSTISGVVQGLNATIFAYGSTGSGKTYTMVGTRDDPGLMVLSLHTIFELINKDSSSDEFEVTCSYLEVYNEVIYDLLEKSSGHLELREDPTQGIVVAGLRSIKVRSADKILELLNLGNSRRKTESTGANATSSRSHAVLEITVKRRQKRKYPNQVMQGKLALVDLAGSERASETKSGGQKLRDGANINRSLLALANCINALGKQQKKGLAYVPYRNSKLTRILKDGLSGNSQTIMVAAISPADGQYHHTVNTLKYANRAKEIKTHIQVRELCMKSFVHQIEDMDEVRASIDEFAVWWKKVSSFSLLAFLSSVLREKFLSCLEQGSNFLNMVRQKNIGTIDTHVSDYQRMIDGLQIEVCHLKEELAEKESQLSIRSTEKAADDELSWLNVLSCETNENVQERINLQKALFELEETNIRNRAELQQLDDAIAKQQAIEKDRTVVDVLRARRQLILDNIRDNDEAGINYRKEIEANEKHQCDLQHKINETINNHGNKTYLRILSQYRLQEMANTELQLEIAMRDQIIHRQRDAQRNLWNLLTGLGLDERRLQDFAAWQGIPIEDYMMTPYMGVSNKNQSPCASLSYSTSSSNFEHFQQLENGSLRREKWNSYCREERRTSYYFISDDASSQMQTRRSQPSVNDRQRLYPGSGNAIPRISQDSISEVESGSRSRESCSSLGASMEEDRHEELGNANGQCFDIDHFVHTSGRDPYSGMRSEHVGTIHVLPGCDTLIGQGSTGSIPRKPYGQSPYLFPCDNARPYSSMHSTVHPINTFTPHLA